MTINQFRASLPTAEPQPDRTHLMQTLKNITAEDAEDALFHIAQNVPLDVEIGTPILASRDEQTAEVAIVTSAAIWWSGDGHASRYVDVSDNRAEITRYERRIETSRSIVPVHDVS